MGSILAFLTEYTLEIGLSSVFVVAYSAYTITKARGQTNKYKLVYYDLTDRIIKSKKAQKKINDKVGGGKNNGDFFKK